MRNQRLGGAFGLLALSICVLGTSTIAHGKAASTTPVITQPALGQFPFEAPDQLRAVAADGLRLAYVQGYADISRWLNNPAHAGATCDEDYARLYSKPVIDVRLAIGYLDYLAPLTLGGGVNFTLPRSSYAPLTADADMGRNMSLSPFVYSAVMTILQRPCSPGGAQVCGFRQTGRDGVLEKQVAGLGGQGAVTFRIRVTQSSASPFYDLNTGRLSGVQAQLEGDSEDNFFNGLRDADIVLYIGHARNGGGPDFRVVVVDGGGHANYNGHYRGGPRAFADRERMYTALRSRGDGGPPVLALMGCLSAAHWGGTLNQIAPGSRKWLAGDVSHTPTLTNGALAALDAAMRRQCLDKSRGAAVLPAGYAGNPGAEGHASARGGEIQIFDNSRR